MFSINQKKYQIGLHTQKTSSPYYQSLILIVPSEKDSLDVSFVMTSGP